MPQRGLAARPVNQDAPDGLGSRGEEMRPIREPGLSFPARRSHASCTRAVGCNVWFGASRAIFEAANLRNSS